MTDAKMGGAPFDRRQFAVFLAGGALCALIDIGLMQLLLSLGAHHAAAASAGFGAGLMVNYVFHTRVTFGASTSATNFARYLAVIAVNYLITLACVALAAAFLDNPLAGKLLSLPLVAINGYLLGKHWIYA